MGSCRRGNSVPSRKTYCATNKITEGKEDEKIKGKSMSICNCISYGIHKDNVLEVSKKIWDYLKAEYEGDERIRGMQVLNLIREFELQRMNESQSIKEYSDRLLSIANKVRLLGYVLKDSRIVEKLLV